MPRRFKTGLRPRRFDSRVPHWSAYAAARRGQLAAPRCDNYPGMAADSDILGNDLWGDCAEAATFREIEIMTFASTGKEVRAQTSDALTLYTSATGFNEAAGPSGFNPTDQGSVLQDLLMYRVMQGVRLPDGSYTKLVAFFELDPRNLNDCRLAIEQGGVIQLGIKCYDSFENVQQGGTWNPPAASEASSGGHAICCGKYEQDSFIIKSWAMDIVMPLPTWQEVVQEAYCVVSPEWVKSTGLTPFGMSLEQLSAAMYALRQA